MSGTDLDANGDTGTWSLSLTVINNIVQTSPTMSSTTPAASATYAPGSILVTNNSGAVTFTTTVTNSALSVSTSGAVTTTGTLAVSVYTVSGTDRDTNGDTGTWTFTLTVANVTADLTFNANAGTGSIALERHDSPSALTTNRFKRSGYTFTSWNTAANFTLSPHRTSAVDTYLKQRLAVLGLKEHSITAKGNGAVAPTSGGAAIKQTKSDLVIATLT